MKLTIFTDGGARGNPGPAGVGFVVINEFDETIYEKGFFIGEATNNVAEYQAVLVSLRWVKEFKSDVSEINYFIDSELVVKQLKGEYRVKDEKLVKLLNLVKTRLSSLKAKVTFTHIPRSKNKRADKLYNLALDATLPLEKIS